VLSGAGMSAHLKNLGDRLLSAWHKRAVGLKAVSFACIGVVNTLIDLAVFLTAYNVLGLALVPANVLAWLVAVSASYVMNSFITFARESGRKLRWRDYGTFVASGIAGVVANTTALVIASYFMPVLAAKLLAILVSFLVNFSLSHFVVFPRRRQPGDARRG
jgi:putative flippase GtrA